MFKKNFLMILSCLFIFLVLLAFIGCGIEAKYETKYIPLKVFSPKFSPLGGVFDYKQFVTIYCDSSDMSDDKDLTIIYTADGTNPIYENGEVKNGIVYKNKLELNSFTILKAIAYKSGIASDIGRSAYSFTVANPIFTPSTGKYGLDQTVEIANSTEDSTIYYTTDGSRPSSSSSKYVTPLTISSPITIKAIAYRFGWSYSDTIEATFSFQVETPLLYPGGNFYDKDQNVIISPTIIGAGIKYTTDGSTPDLSSDDYTSPILINSTTTLKAISVKGDMEPSNIAFGEYLMKVATPKIEPATGIYKDDMPVSISCDTSGVSIYYTTDDTTPDDTKTLYTSPILTSSFPSESTTDRVVFVTFRAIAYKSGYLNSESKSEGITIRSDYAEKSDEPVFDLDSGEYTSPQTISLSALEGAYIKYTIDGSVPSSNNGFIYSEPIILEKTTTIKAINCNSVKGFSDIVTKNYIITGTVDDPIVTIDYEEAPDNGTFNSAKILELSCSTPDSVIRYTYDGSEPTTDSYICLNPGTLSISGGHQETLTLKFKAFRKDWTPSDTITKIYSFKLPEPVFNPIGETGLTKAVYLTISQPVLIADTYYTIDGSDPKTSGTSKLYDGPILINSYTTVKAYSKANNWIESEVVTNTYEFQ